MDYYKDRKLADLALPDGGHLYTEDATLIVLDPPPSEIFQSTEKGPLYGMVYFRNKPDSTVKRGAIQKSFLLFSFKPLFTVFEPLMKIGLSRILDKGEKPDKVLKSFYTALTDESVKKELSINLWSEKILIKMPKLVEDQFVGASLIDLVQKFKKDTMLIWNGLLTGKRIMFVGTPAKQVLNCCLATPLLVQPLTGFSKNIHPYIALTDLEPIMKKGVISGTTNLLFESKPDIWWDICASFASGTVIGKYKGDKNDRIHIYNVLGGIKDGKNEQWVREQFLNYTKKFIESVAHDTSTKKISEAFKSTPYYDDYLKNQNKEVKKVSVSDILEELKKGEQLPILDRVKKIFELKTITEDLSNIDEVCNLNGVEIVSKFLGDTNSQYRKYSASVLAQLASSVKGQLAILSGDILPNIIKLLDDEMPNVRSGASYCIMKISELYVGVKSLLQNNIVEKLKLDSSDIIDIKTSYIMTMYNIFRYAPNTKKPDVKMIKDDLSKSGNLQYNNTILNLLDLLKEDLKDVVKISTKSKKILNSLSEKEVIQECLHELVNDPCCVYELIQGGIVQIILKDFKKGRWISLEGIQILIYIADTNYGINNLLQTQALKQATKLLNTCRPDLYHLTLLQFIDCICQYEQSCQVFQECNGIEYLIKIISKHYYSALTSSLCVKALKCLYNFLRTIENRDSVSKSLEPLEKLPYVKPQNFGSLIDGFEDFEGERTKKFVQSFESLGAKNVLNEMLEKILFLVGRKIHE